MPISLAILSQSGLALWMTFSKMAHLSACDQGPLAPPPPPLLTGLEEALVVLASFLTPSFLMLLLLLLLPSLGLEGLLVV